MQWTIAKKVLSRKSLALDLALPAIVVLVGVGAFGLGRLSVERGSQVPLQIHGPIVGGVEQKVLPAAAAAAPSSLQTTSDQGSFVASKSGTKYYPLGCAGVSRIKEENKVYFKTAEKGRCF